MDLDLSLKKYLYLYPISRSIHIILFCSPSFSFLLTFPPPPTKQQNNPSTTTTTTTYTYDTYTNINNTLIANYMGYSLFQSPSSSSSTTYVGYGASVYIFGVTEKFPPDSANCQNATREGMDSILFLEGVTDNFAGIFPSVENKVDLVCSDVPDFDMTGMNWFQVVVVGGVIVVVVVVVVVVVIVVMVVFW